MGEDAASHQAIGRTGDGGEGNVVIDWLEANEHFAHDRCASAWRAKWQFIGQNGQFAHFRSPPAACARSIFSYF